MHIEQNHLSLEGIFRMPGNGVFEFSLLALLRQKGTRLAGNIDETKQLRDLVNNGEHVDLWKASSGYVICDLLRIYFREYPDSIVPSSLYSAFVDLAQKASRTSIQHKLHMIVALTDC